MMRNRNNLHNTSHPDSFESLSIVVNLIIIFNQYLNHSIQHSKHYQMNQNQSQLNAMKVNLFIIILFNIHTHQLKRSIMEVIRFFLNHTKHQCLQTIHIYSLSLSHLSYTLNTKQTIIRESKTIKNYTLQFITIHNC